MCNFSTSATFMYEVLRRSSDILSLFTSTCMGISVTTSLVQSKFTHALMNSVTVYSVAVDMSYMINLFNIFLLYKHM